MTDQIEKGLWIALAGLIALVGALFIYNGTFPEWQKPTPGVVIEREHESERTRVGTGAGVVRGKVGAVTTASFDPERWVVIVKTEGHVRSVNTSAETWLECTNGAPVQYQVALGRIFHDRITEEIFIANPK